MLHQAQNYMRTRNHLLSQESLTRPRLKKHVASISILVAKCFFIRYCEGSLELNLYMDKTQHNTFNCTLQKWYRSFKMSAVFIREVQHNLYTKDQRDKPVHDPSVEVAGCFNTRFWYFGAPVKQRHLSLYLSSCMGWNGEGNRRPLLLL